MRQVWDSKLDRGKCNRPNEVRLFIRRLNNSCWIWLTPQKDIIEWMILSDRFCSLIVRQGRAHAVKRMKHFLFQLSFNHTSENLYFTKTILPLPKKAPNQTKPPTKPQIKRWQGLGSAILLFTLIYLLWHLPTGNTKEICTFVWGVLLGKEQSAADMKGTEKSAISQPLPYNIYCNISDHIKAVAVHHFHGTARAREKQTWHQIHPSSSNRYPPAVLFFQCLM